MAPILEIRDLHKSFGTTEVLKDIDIAIEPGDFLVLVGPSGCGKSTLLNCIAGLEQITSGQILIDGKDMSHTGPKDRNIAMVFQSYALYPTMSVAKNITFGMQVRGVDQKTQKRRLNEIAKLLQIEKLLNRRPGQLSGGQRQRVAMGRALVRNPKLFLFDEPLSNLDAKLRVEMRSEIKKLHHGLGATIIYVTHDQIEAMTLATKIAVMEDGVIQQIGSPTEVYNKPANVFVADFIGSPAMNLIPAKVRASSKGSLLEIERDDQGNPLVLLDESRVDLPENVVLGLRPEDIGGKGFRTGHNVQNATCHLELVELAGSDTFVVTRLGGSLLTARLNAETEAEADQDIELSFDMSKASYFFPDTGKRVV